MIKLVQNRVAIVPLENPDKIGSIIVPDIAKERLNQGFVKYRGPETVDLKVGDYVLFSQYTGTLMSTPEDGKMIIMPEDFVVAVIGNIENTDGNMTIPGVYFKDSHGDFYTANYEMIMQYVGMAFSESDKWRERIKIQTMEKPTLNDYDKMRVKT